ncbi:hypothetical protein RIF29_13549 [Crotalaria pallida]|uniref:Uncharacterized protein n=1 Tax=Crotalaria pallida TaxID=3830 RepID=A0AAN9P227_CROPI
MWVSVPQLKFGIDFFRYCFDRDIEDEVPDIITEVLFLHNGPISKFNLFLSKRSIKHLELLSHEQCYNLIDLTLNLERIGVSDLIQGLPKIQRLCLGEDYIKVLSRGVIPQTLQKSINSIKSLELDGVDFNQPRHLLFIVSLLLKSSSNLVELVINGVRWGSRGVVPPLQDNLRAIDCNSCCLSQLKKVNITVTTVFEHEHDEHALNLISSSLCFSCA